ncbi:hypothetical protein [Thiocapsa sp.]|uniref:hypothetical protein n=1 Tax=Thiocapsa sp. TaxID=2024551 RepID=UPI001BD062BB|nr:hypothetical protein [Thiocapsa sp.]
MPRHPPTPWHRLFGIALTDLFTGRPWRVELELELALKSQRLDVLIIERLSGQAADLRDPAALADLPDGLEGLGAHNILTYKSAQESLDAWAVDELIGHYVTYRKLVSEPPAPGPAGQDGDPVSAPAGGRLLPAADFRLYAVATRQPTGLLRRLHPAASHATAWPGVYDLTWGHRAIRLIVLNRIADHPRNAPWQLFASELERVRSGLNHYRPCEPAALLLRYHLAQVHHLELPGMAYTLEDFKHDTLRLLIEDVDQFTPEERAALLERMDAEDRLRGLPTEERLRGLSTEEILSGLDPDVIKAWLERTGH